MTMLVPFVIDAESITPDPQWTRAQLRACHNNFLDIWMRLGLLAYDGNLLEVSHLYKVIQTLPQSVRLRWLELLEKSPLLKAAGWNSKVTPTLLSEFASVAQLAFVDDVQAEVEFGFDEDLDEALLTLDGVVVSVCRILTAAQAQAFKKASVLAASHIEKGDTYQQTWDARFKTLAKAPIKNVTIVDRFAIRQHFKNNISGLRRFLQLLDTDATGPRYVTIYSTWPEDSPNEIRKNIDDIENEVRFIFSKLPFKNIKSIRVFMAPNSGFRLDSHDRFVRFGNYVWDIGKGLNVFDGAFCSERSQAAFKTIFDANSYKSVERDLEANEKTKKTNEIK